MRTLKEERRSLFLALQADAKKYPGGITALAKILNKSKEGLANSLDPNHESQPPSFATIVNIIDLTQEKRALFELCQIIDHVPMDLDLDDSSSKECQINQFLTLVNRASEFLGKGSEAIKDLRFDASEKRDLAPLLLELMQVTAKLYKSFNDQ